MALDVLLDRLARRAVALLEGDQGGLREKNRATGKSGRARLIVCARPTHAPERPAHVQAPCRPRASPARPPAAPRRAPRGGSQPVRPVYLDHDIELGVRGGRGLLGGGGRHGCCVRERGEEEEEERGWGTGRWRGERASGETKSAARPLQTQGGEKTRKGAQRHALPFCVPRVQIASDRARSNAVGCACFLRTF